MPAKKYVVTLSVEERVALGKVSVSNRRSVREKKRARMLLLCDSGVSREDGGSQSDHAIALRLKVSALTVSNVRQRACERGALDSVVRAAQTKRKARALDGVGEAHLVALTCSAPPEGCARWTLKLLRERLIEREVVESIGQETIRQTLKKTRSNLG